MKIQGDVQLALEKIGLGTICTKHYELYPDLVRQFMAMVQVYYSATYPRAQEGMLTFFIRGVRYRISIPELCTIFGFATHPTSTTLDGNATTDIQTYWSRFAEGRYSSRGSTQTDIRHPVLRYVAPTILHTILCKMEPGKMRESELFLLFAAIQDPFTEDWTEMDDDVNMGAIFAHHLVSLKTKPFTGSGTKFETVGSLLTPIMHYCGISTEGVSRKSERNVMDEDFLRHAGWIKPDWVWSFRSAGVEYLIQLPQPALTRITGDVAHLLFQPDQTLTRRAPPPRRMRGASSRSVPTATEDDIVQDLGASLSSQQYALPPTPHIPMETAVFQRYVVESFQSVWNAMASLSHCGCVRRTDAVVPPHSSPIPIPSPSDTEED
ncbi:hypothetical protein V5N11_009017 [Cardamine amara subsp. amara]|uniref:Arabidopsis retrotransposon Orf1 C-terminal domain-containing protein n=1 Tax=Cardamine amara subsp. amara TaxID=228776 RepID=A0ABD1C795_CARAN